VRALGELMAVREKGSTVEATVKLTYEIEGSDRSPCFAELVVLYQT
jgi:hypothetical protein